MTEFLVAGKKMPLSKTHVMGVINVTPDSFSDGGKYFDPGRAVARAIEMEKQGVAMVDVGGQSTRPGNTRISAEEEWERISLVIPAILKTTGLAISVDTYYPEVAEKALAVGAHIINDVTGFSEQMWQVVMDSDCGCIVMHPGDPNNVAGVSCDDIVEEVHAFFLKKAQEAKQHGIETARLCFDPGIGFGKNDQQNLTLLANPDKLRVGTSPILMAASRKRIVGTVCGVENPAERMVGTVAAHSLSCAYGANIVRAHDTAEAIQAAKMADAIKRYRRG